MHRRTYCAHAHTTLITSCQTDNDNIFIQARPEWTAQCLGRIQVQRDEQILDFKKIDVCAKIYVYGDIYTYMVSAPANWDRPDVFKSNKMSRS